MYTLMHCYTNVKYTTHFATPAVAVACKDTMPELSFSVWVFLVLKKGDFSIKVTNYGATCIVLRVLSVVLPDKNGKLDDVVLGYDSIEDYSNGTTYFGALVGRVANRIGDARFTLKGVVYHLSANDGNNTLHGGKTGFSEMIWTVEDYQANSHITLNYNSPDGQYGFPGDVSVEVTYILMAGTAYDFLQSREIGSKIGELSNGYDINYVLDGTSKKHLNKAAIVHDSKSGRKMELWTNQLGVQFYTSNMIDNVKGKLGFVYQKYAGLGFKTQGFPDAVNQQIFPSQIVNPGETYEHIMVYYV